MPKGVGCSFFFSSRRRHTRFDCDWSSDVCSSDLFSYLIVPAAIAALFAAGVRGRLLIAWALGAALSAAGLYASWTWDLPTGPAIVAAFGAATALVALGFAFKRLSVLWFARMFFMVLALAGLLLAAFPGMDQPWLDALGNAAPAVQEAFLTPDERATRRASVDSIAAASAELARLRPLDQDVRWGSN